MTLCEYCYKKGMTLNEFHTLESNLLATAEAFKVLTQKIHDNGMFYKLSEWFECEQTTDIFPYLINTMKKIGFEFRNEEDGLYFRY